MELQQILSEKINDLEQKLEKINKELSLAPKGYIRVAYKKKYPQYYYLKDRNDRNGTYINKNQTALLQAILVRDYNKKVKKVLEMQIKILKKCYSSYKPELLAQVFETTPKARRGNIVPIMLTKSKYIQEWQNKPYTPKTIETTYLLTSTNLQVRSKSELIIAEVLIKYSIPFRYEYPIKVGAKIIHPDFTCLNTHTRKEFFWEHFGLMDNSNYEDETLWKLQNYSRNNYILGKNLIATFEDKRHPLTTVEVEKIVQSFLL